MTNLPQFYIGRSFIRLNNDKTRIGIRIDDRGDTRKTVFNNLPEIGYTAIFIEEGVKRWENWTLLREYS